MSLRPSTCQETASPAVESRSSAATHRSRCASSTPALPLFLHRALSVPRISRWSSSSPPRLAPATQNIRPAPLSGRARPLPLHPQTPCERPATAAKDRPPASPNASQSPPDPHPPAGSLTLPHSLITL